MTYLALVRATTAFFHPRQIYLRSLPEFKAWKFLIISELLKNDSLESLSVNFQGVVCVVSNHTQVTVKSRDMTVGN